VRYKFDIIFDRNIKIRNTAKHSETQRNTAKHSETQRKPDVHEDSGMIFRRFQQIAFFVVLVEVFRTLYGTGIFQPIEDYLVDMRERLTERLALVTIKVGGGLSLLAIFVRILLSIDPIYYLIFFTCLLIAYNTWGSWKEYRDNEFVVIDGDQVLENILEDEYIDVGKEDVGKEYLEDEDDDWETVDN